MKRILLFVLISIVLSSCQTCSRQFGGTTTTRLHKGKKLMNISWKDDDLWYLTRDMLPTDTAQTYLYGEDSNLGMMNGKVIIIETK